LGLLQVEVTAFHRNLIRSSLWPYSSPYTPQACAWTGFRRTAVNRHPALWSPDLPPADALRASQRLSGLLHGAIVLAGGAFGGRKRLPDQFSATWSARIVNSSSMILPMLTRMAPSLARRRRSVPMNDELHSAVNGKLTVRFNTSLPFARSVNT
jgi:hypothetical protein